MKAPDLEMVFGKPKKGAPEMDAPETGDLEMEEDAEEASSALDSAIDDVFASSDPEARREAFKTAIRLCKEEEDSY